ncbi:tetratricopeptide repeat protein [Lacunisphaera limnophila]|uniref:tetratricopeptide repeat protein n=1 Tax=Lacunisphaera limnophila TaxID=1838286 RepID=UPI0009F53191|nr:tetratricopeptide repeat protein [Lacunisphaera limnophila]
MIEQLSWAIIPTTLPKYMITIWIKEAEQGDANAQFRLGASYLSGHGVAQNFDTALGWLRKAAEQGHVRAQLAIGDILLRSPKTSDREAEGVAWIRTAATGLAAQAEGGDGSAVTELIKIYSGIYVQTRDPFEALVWLKVASSLGDTGSNPFISEIEGSMSAATVALATTTANERFARIPKGH